MHGTRQRILIVDDEETIRYVISEVLKREGFDVATAADGQAGLVAFDETQPDLVLLDVNMPLVNGFEVCRQLKADPQKRLVPVIIVTSSSSTDGRMKGLEAGADDFICKPVDRLELIARVRSLLRIKGYMDELERAETVLFALARSIEGKDPYTEGHCERLAVYGEKLALRMGLDPEEVIAVQRAGIVHDIGKVAVPDAVLLKPGPLDESERSIMQRHAIVGERICQGLKSFRLVLPIIRHHHEKRDGTGYPDGLSGNDIPLTARVLQIVDIYDALTTKRPYKRALSDDEALALMRKEIDRGWWDPDVFREFCALIGTTSGDDEILRQIPTSIVNTG